VKVFIEHGADPNATCSQEVKEKLQTDDDEIIDVETFRVDNVIRSIMTSESFPSPAVHKKELDEIMEDLRRAREKLNEDTAQEKEIKFMYRSNTA